MNYYIASKTALDFDAATAKVKEALAAEGFGVLTEIDVAATFRNKLDINFRPYRILGACNPHLAHHALMVEPHIGTLLPCNVIVQELPEGGVEVAAIDPVESLRGIENEALADMAASVRDKLKRAVNAAH